MNFKERQRRGLVAKGCLSHSLTEAEKQKVRSWVDDSLAKFKEGTAGANDWYNLLFRIQVGLELARAFYEDTTIAGMVAAKEACLVVMRRFNTDTVWRATPGELDEIESGLDAVNTMTGENIRRELLHAHYEAREALKKYVA